MLQRFAGGLALASLLLAGGFAVGAEPDQQPTTRPALTGIVLTNDRTVDCTSNQAIANGIWHEGMNDQQKCYAMWQFFISRNMHKDLAEGMIDPGNAAELMTKTGYCLCGEWARLWERIMADNGMTATGTGLNGHNIGSSYYWGAWHAYDTDMADLYVLPNGVVADPNMIRSMKDEKGNYVLRNGAPIKSYPFYVGPDSLKEINGLYAKVNIGPIAKPVTNPRWVYNLGLRPGQHMVWSWYGDPDVGFVSVSHLPNDLTKHKSKSLRDYIEGTWDYYQEKEGKPAWSWGNRRGGLRPNPLQSWNGNDGNGRLVMDLSADGFKNALAMASSSDNLQVEGGKLALKDSSKPGSIVLDFAIPYLYGDAWIEKPLPEKGLKIELSLDGKSFKPVYPANNMADDGQRIRLFDVVRDKSKFELRFTLDAGAAPLEHLKAVGAFHLTHTVLPAVVLGKNDISVRIADPAALANCPLYVTYVYDQVTDDHQVMRQEKVFTFTPTTLTQALDVGNKHWPLMREIRLQAGGEAPIAAAPTQETGELDWGAAPWNRIYYGVNFWNDFERGDRAGWVGKLTTENTFNNSDFSLEDNVLTADGSRQFKIMYFGGFLNRDTHFRCMIYVKNAASLSIGSRNDDPTAKDKAYFHKDFTDLKDGQWQPVEFALNDLTIGDEHVQNGWYMANLYIQIKPKEGVDPKDVKLMLDNAVCYDGILKNDPCTDPDAPAKALAEDPIWNAKPPASQPAEK